MLRRRLLARAAAARGLLLVTVTIGMVLAAGAASAAIGSGPSTHGAMPFASGSTKKVIVLLRDKAAGLGARSTARSSVVRAEVRPLAQSLRAHGATHVSSGNAFPFVVASVSSAQEKALQQNSAVKAVFPDSVIPEPIAQLPSESQPITPSIPTTSSPTPTEGPSICGTANSPEQDPEALSVINAPGATALGIDGAGVKTAYIAGSNDTTITDFKRNAKYASAGSPTGSPVVSQVNFAGDTIAPPFDVEAFIDSGSIASQGNTVWDLSKFVNVHNPLPKGCDITITGSAPGATVLGLDTFSNEHDTTTANFIQAIDYAVTHGVNVLNESFGSNNFPDTALDATRIADDDAVAAGVTVVVSSGDSGVTSTLGSPSTDSNLISVGASTTFRTYQQDTYGGINAKIPNATNGTWIDNNISGLSSGGFSQSGGNTVNLVAPGDLNWIDCSTNTCTDENGNPSGIDFSGGTSESSPLTAGAAADVIQAYRKTHGGASPTPALVKQILVSTATDIDAPAEQQGAGLLNIGAAVKLAESINHASGTPKGGLLISPNQINITQYPGTHTARLVSITNTATHPVSVNLSTRTLSHRVASQSGSFCLNPTSGNISCGPPTANAFHIWSGVTEVYQEETFTVPHTGTPSRLNFSANYQYTGQASLLHVALYDPSGAYAGYSLPQGIGDYANIQISDPKAGTWTAVFFTEQGPDDTGTNGTILWEADTWTYGQGGVISPGALTIPAGGTRSAVFTPSPTLTPGDVADSIVLNSSDGSTNTVPVTVRTLVQTAPGATGGAFSGVLTGGNGRGNPAQTNTYAFDVPAGQHDIDASVNLGTFDDGVVAFLIDPEGNTVANSSNITLDSTGQNYLGTGTVNVYKDNPQSGRWMLVLDWLPPVFGVEFSELSQPFTGRIQFNQVNAGSNLPSGATLKQGQSYTYDVTVKNTGQSPQTFFLDPRLDSSTTMQLPSLGISDQNMTLPLPPFVSSPPFPYYDVPTDTSAVHASLTGSAPVTFDIEPFSGDPDLYSGTSGDSASVIYNSGDEVQSGLWLLNPSEVGPYSGEPPAVTASANFSIVTQAFDPTVDPSTGDLWLVNNGLSSSFDPVYLNPGQSATIPLTITPSAGPGSHVSGFINLDDVFQANFDVGISFASGDELASLPFSYTVSH
jgi:Subtilase family